MSETVLQTHTEHMLTGITGMTCSACATRLEKALQRAPGVQTATVNFATEQADISFDADSMTAATVADVIAKAGFGVNEAAFTFNIGGMTCSACAARIEKALLKVPGVLEATVNLALERADAKLVAARHGVVLATKFQK